MPQSSKIKSFVAPLRLAFVAFAALLVAACIPTSSDDNGETEVITPPVISYGLPVEDIDDVRYHLVVSSVGGPVTRYAAEPELPENASLDSVTGRIDYEIPGTLIEWKAHLIIATGPGGADTASVILPSLHEPDPVDGVGTFLVQIGLRSAFTSSLGTALDKTSALTLSKLVITLTSSEAADSVIRDTILADTSSAFSSSASVNQSYTGIYQIKALRSWSVEAKTIDVNDVVIHQGEAQASNVLAGETRVMTLNLTSGFRPHVAMFTFPDSVAMTTGATKQKLSVSRIVMTINGDTVRDTTRASVFASSPTVHHLAWDYVASDSAHVVGLFVYADGFGSWPATQPAFGGTFLVTDTSATTVQQLPWLGGAGTGPTLTVQYGPVNSVVTEPPIDPNPLPRRAATSSRPSPP